MEANILYFCNLILRLAFLCNNFVVKVYRGRYISFWNLNVILLLKFMKVDILYLWNLNVIRRNHIFFIENI